MHKSIVQIKFLYLDLERYWGEKKFFGCSFFTVFIWIQSWNNVSYRIRRCLLLAPWPINWISRPIRFIIDRVFSLLLGTNLPESAEIGPAFYIAHIGPFTIGMHTRAGTNFFIRQGVTVGGNGKDFGHPCFGNNVTLGANCCVVGPINVGDNAAVGANTFLNKNLCSGGKALGVSCRIFNPTSD